MHNDSSDLERVVMASSKGARNYFSPLQEPTPPPRVDANPDQLIVEYPQAVVTSEDVGNTGTNIPTITQDDDESPQRPGPRTAIPHFSPITEHHRVVADPSQSPLHPQRTPAAKPGKSEA